MRTIKQRLLTRWVPDYELLKAKSKQLNFYERFFPKFIDPQVVSNKMPQSLTTDGEVKDVCVVFTDVRGFTRFSEKASLPAANSFLNNFYDIVIHHTQAHGGIVDKFMGDGTMAIFGAFGDKGDYTRNAVEATKAILRDFVMMTNQKNEPSLFLGAGISKGPAIVGMFGNGDFVTFTAIGHTVNIASRLQGQASKNSIYATKEVVSQLSEKEYRSKGRFELKNVSRKIELFEIGA